VVGSFAYGIMASMGGFMLAALFDVSIAGMVAVVAGGMLILTTCLSFVLRRQVFRL